MGVTAPLARTIGERRSNVVALIVATAAWYKAAAVQRCLSTKLRLCKAASGRHCHRLAYEDARRPVSRVLSAHLWFPSGARDDHSSGTRLAARLTRPTRTARRECLRSLAAAAVPIRSCSRWGLPCRPCYQGRGALLPHRFALARGAPEGPCAGGVFSVALSLRSPSPAVGRHRIPVEPGLSSAGSPGRARGQAAAVRPSGAAGNAGCAGPRQAGQPPRRRAVWLTGATPGARERQARTARKASITAMNPSGLSACSQCPARFSVTNRAAGNNARIAGRCSART